MSSVHKYYVSVTQLSYVEEKKSVQLISRIDISDLELTLQKRYDKTIKMTTIDEKPIVEDYLKKYLTQKISIKINTKETPFVYLGREYKNDLLVCYLEIENVEDISTIEISNSLLFELFPEQKNIVKTKINSEVNNLIFTKNDNDQYLNFK